MNTKLTYDGQTQENVTELTCGGKTFGISATANLQTKTANANGEVTADSEYDGLEKVIVDVVSAGGASNPNYHNGEFTVDSDKEFISNGNVTPYTIDLGLDKTPIAFMMWRESGKVDSGAVYNVAVFPVSPYGMPDRGAADHNCNIIQFCNGSTGALLYGPNNADTKYVYFNGNNVTLGGSGFTANRKIYLPSGSTYKWIAVTE